MVIDFKEIPPANTSTGDQDLFEMFARDFVSEILGFRIISQPNRGADGGKDILAEEIQHGVLSTGTIKWLISCKHFAHSGQSVSEAHEQNITDRLSQHGANGFIGFYSTIASSGLGNRLDSITAYQTITFDRMEIERRILSSGNTALFERYFPISYRNWRRRNHQPIKLLDEYQPLCCAVCGKDLLQNRSDGNILFTRQFESNQIEDVVPVCRGTCNRVYERGLRDRGYGNGWESIEDYTIPTIYLKKQMALINNLFYEDYPEDFTESGIEAYKTVLIALSQLVLRECTEEEHERASLLSAFEF